MKLNFSTVLGSALVTTGFVSMIAVAPAAAASTAGICSITDVLLGNIPATACEGAFEGNDTGSKSTLLSDLNDNIAFKDLVAPGTTWSLGAKSDDAGSWLSADQDENSGDWSLLNAISSGTFVLSLKTAGYYSTYLFKDIDFTSTGLQGIFDTIGVSFNLDKKTGDRTAQDLSHASIFVASGGTTVPPVTPVPEPATLLGLAVVGGGLSLSRRRKSTSC
ncbi:PEP-CTERM sorting domain-containing protein [Laspinema sp. D1]|uniref:PEP-CTERM sorting domain-containing protein n=1 Tax=Laspinema palackyanum D2a TaxID=2953684 RepID=A0ABT2MKN3_9CYAN|nr:PEP-CTERM sorting domain-containing protein [Laspinema sp. D2b]MCT7965305.1 PEP-CTERM sorting domain-containing protein [Laspinema sp. D2a]